MSAPDFSSTEEPIWDASAVCANHPNVAAVQVCQQCQAPLCRTCDFAFPGNLHLCPTCATTTTRPVSGTRKMMLTWSLIAAFVTTAILVLSMAGVFAEMVTDEIGATIFGYVILIPNLAGLTLSFASLEKRAGNPPLFWVAVVWNVLLGVIWLILILVGLTME